MINTSQFWPENELFLVILFNTATKTIQHGWFWQYIKWWIWVGQDWLEPSCLYWLEFHENATLWENILRQNWWCCNNGSGQAVTWESPSESILGLDHLSTSQSEKKDQVHNTLLTSTPSLFRDYPFDTTLQDDTNPEWQSIYSITVKHVELSEYSRQSKMDELDEGKTRTHWK